MKNHFKRMWTWTEHKSKDKKPEGVIKDDTIEALKKMIKILDQSRDCRSEPQKKKITSIKETIQKIISETQQNEKQIEHHAKLISQKQLAIANTER